MQAPDIWNSSLEHSGLVSIGGLSLHLSIAGPLRTSSKQPVVILEAGLGSSSAEWIAVLRLISTFARVLSYDRSGYGLSDPPGAGLQLTAHNRVKELSSLLNAAGIAPPYVLVGHSYGGVLVREFLAQNGSERVAGMVIVDSAPERYTFPDTWPTLLGEAEYAEVVGLEANHVLSDQEWATVKLRDGTEMDKSTAEMENALMEGNASALRAQGLYKKQALGRSPLSVVFCDEAEDMRKVLARAENMRIGTQEARDELQRFLKDSSRIDEDRQREHLQLSCNARFTKTSGSGRTHNVQLVQPEILAEEVRWIIAELLKYDGSGEGSDA